MPPEESNQAVQILRNFIDSPRHSDSQNVRKFLLRIRGCFKPFFHDKAKVRRSSTGGMGVFAEDSLSAGTCILVEHPVVSVLDCENGALSHQSEDGGDSVALIAEIVKSYNEETEDCLRSLYPIRTGQIPCTEVPLAYRDLMDRLGSFVPPDMTPVSVVRAVQLNSLGFYTFPELVSYNEHLRFMTGTGLYRTASMFNHSCEPNVNHYSIGDVTFFRLKKNVMKGDELFISYIGSDLLCETKSIRDEFLGTRDFHCRCTKCLRPDEKEDDWLEEIDLETRININLKSSSIDRITFMKSLLSKHAYITRDRRELRFRICREAGMSAREEWLILLDEIGDDEVDFSSIIVYVHYLVHLGYDEIIGKRVLDTARICLGDLGTKPLLYEILASTDFVSSTKFSEVWNQLD
jgi:hypothetical protein